MRISYRSYQKISRLYQIRTFYCVVHAQPRREPLAGTVAPIQTRRTFSQTMAEAKEVNGVVEPTKAGKPEDTVHPNENWKYEAPYRVHEPSENFDAKYEASCHCGQVKYQLCREAPLDSKMCHCRDCQVRMLTRFNMHVEWVRRLQWILPLILAISC